MPIKKEHLYKFLFFNQKAAIGLNDITKGINITDNQNHLKSGEDYVELENHLNKFNRGHVMKITDDESENDHFKELQFLYEPVNGREVFIFETYFTDILIFLQFEDFNEEVFNDDNLRNIYNEKVIECLNQFIIKYNKVTRTGNFRHLQIQQASASYILKQAYSPIDESYSFEYYLKKGLQFDLKGTSIIFGSIGTSGRIATDTSRIDDLTHKIEEELTKSITIEESFLSHALEQCTIKSNYKYAFLEAFLAVESSVESFLENNFEDFKKDAVLSNKINIQIPLALSGILSNNFQEILTDINLIRQKRNQVVHKGINISGKEAYEAINKIYSFVHLLESNSLISI